MRAFQKDPSLSGKRVSIIGGTGGMGKLFAKLLKKHVKEVIICSRNFNKAKKIAENLDVAAWRIEDCSKADIVLVSVPVEQTYEICREISNKMKKGSLLIEISSVKNGIADKLSNELIEKKIEYLSLHPLFGPQIMRLKGKRIVIVKLPNSRSSSIVDKVIDIFSLEDALIIESSIEEHDKLMAVVQVAHHFTYLAFLAMARYYDVRSMKLFTTESLKKTVKTLKIIEKNLDTIIAIQKMNPYAKEARSLFIESVDALNKMDQKSLDIIQESISKWKN